MSPSPDIVVLTETWLHPGIADAELGLHEYNVFRRDRYNFPDSPYGGGVLIAVKNHLKSKLVLSGENFEEIYIEVSELSKNLIVGCFYAPYVVSECYISHVNSVESLVDKFKNNEFLILGDYNLKETLWFNSGELSDSLLIDCWCSNNLVQENAALVMNLFSFLGMQQYFPVHCNKGYTLDLAFSTLMENNFSVIDSLDSLVPLDAHHDQAFFEVCCKPLCDISRVKNKLDYSKADYDAINDKILKINWDVVFEDGSIESNASKFYSVMDRIIAEHVPVCKSVNNTYPNWYSVTLISYITNKKKMHKQWLKFNVYNDYIEFKRLRALCIRQSKIDREQYISKVECKSSKNAKYFWNYVNKLSKSNSIPNEMFLNNFKSNNAKSTCNLFARNFELVYLQAESSFFHQLLLNDELDFTISHDEIVSTILGLKEKKSIDPDGLSSFFVKKCISSIVAPLYLLYNKSLRLGHMPNIWKKTYITPVYKAGNKQDILNYRPIAIIGTISKIFDSIVASNLNELCIIFIIRNQHGFVKGRSTLTNLIFYNNFISEALNDQTPGIMKQVDSVYLDFAKAFDSVNHSLLIYKLSKFGLSGCSLKWISSFLSDRQLQVRIKGNLSEPFLATSGVPQGSHLGPLLFILFINDVANDLTTATILVFADDIKVSKRVLNLYDQICLQKDLDKIYLWSCLNKIKLNCNKCKFISFVRSKTNRLSFQYSINGLFLEKVDNIKDLGVIYQSNFEFDMQVRSVTSRAFKLLGFIKRSTKEFKSTNSIINLYKSLIRPILLYGSIIWSPHVKYLLRELESVQHKLFRYIAFKMGRRMSVVDHDYHELALSLQLESIKSLHVYHDIYFIKKVQLGLISCDSICNLFIERVNLYNLRVFRMYNERSSTRDYIFYSSVPRLRRKWNKIAVPAGLSNVNNLSQFKRELKILVNRYF